MRKLVARCVLLAVAVLSTQWVSAEPVSSLKATGYVNDFAGVLDEAARAYITQTCQQLDQKANAQVAVVTINSTDGKDIFDYSVDLYQKWGIGQKGKDRGVLILLAVKDRRYFVNVGYGLEPILPDGKVGGFGREAVPYLKQADYSGAAKLILARVAGVIAADAGISLENQPAPVRSANPQDDTSTSFSYIWVVLVILIVMFTPLRRLLFYGLLFGGFGGGRRSGGGWGSGGGGFGGDWGGDGGWSGGGGGGFGGFGGGSTGGGGAGGSW